MTEILITSSALTLALLLIRKLFSGSLSRRVQYALWALVLVAAVSACTFTGGNSNKVVVFIDIASKASNANEDGEYKFAIQGFLNWIDDCNKYYGLGISSENIEVDVIPWTESDVATRSAALQRIRTEIMAGKGPDIFICSSFTEGGIPGGMN